MNKYPAAVKVVDNKVRFNKNFDQNNKREEFSPSYNQNIGMGTVRNRGVLIRKYKVGELPDIQITTKDLMDPMLFLANRDQ